MDIKQLFGFLESIATFKTDLLVTIKEELKEVKDQMASQYDELKALVGDLVTKVDALPAVIDAEGKSIKDVIVAYQNMVAAGQAPNISEVLATLHDVVDNKMGSIKGSIEGLVTPDMKPVDPTPAPTPSPEVPPVEPFEPVVAE